ATRYAGSRRLYAMEEDRCLPVALPAEAVTVRHQPLACNARKLPEATEILEVGGERREPAPGEEFPEAGFDTCGIAQGVMSFTADPQLRHDVVVLLIILDQRVDGPGFDRIDHGNQV